MEDQQEPTRYEEAIRKRLALLRHLPVDLGDLERRMRRLLPPPPNRVTELDRTDTDLLNPGELGLRHDQ